MHKHGIGMHRKLAKKGNCRSGASGRAFLVREASAEAAAQVMKRLREHFGQTAPANPADEAFTATDKYLNGMWVFRKGNIIRGFADLKTGDDGVEQSAKPAANIR
jgi:hypothetical protein